MSHDPGGHVFVSTFAGLFFILAAVIVISVLLASLGRRIHWGHLVAGGLSLLWLVPVILIVILVGMYTVRRTSFSGVPARMVAVDDSRSFPQSEIQLGNPQRLVIPAEAPDSAVVAPKPSAQSPPAEAPLGQRSSPVPVDKFVPDWVKEQEIVSNDKRLLVLTSQRFATINESDAEILKLARNEIEKDLRATYHYKGSPIIPEQEIQQAFGRRYVEEFTVKTETSTFPVYVVHRQMEISPSMRQSLAKLWRESIGNQQLARLGTLAGFITLIFATLTAYFRLDTRTKSAYRGRLRFAAVCLIAAAGVIAMRKIGG